MTKKKPDDGGDDSLQRQIDNLAKRCAEEEGISPSLWMENLMDAASEWRRQNPERAKRLVVMADMETRIGRAILNPEMDKWMNMHPEMSIEDFAAFIRRTFQPN